MAGRAVVEVEAPILWPPKAILWPPDAKSRHLRKDPDAGKDGKQKGKGMAEDEMIR